MKILVIDNYDSFVFNLVHMIYDLGVNEIEVRKNDEIEIEEVAAFDKILLSPGPGIPKEAGNMQQILEVYGSKKSFLGVCLGHQAIAESFGGSLINLKEPLHGIASEMTVSTSDYLFENIPQKFKVGHYHSWCVNQQLPRNLEILATDSNGNIMALRHKEFDLRGVQFHPESVLTENGKQIINNWLKN